MQIGKNQDICSEMKHLQTSGLSKPSPASFPVPLFCCFKNVGASWEAITEEVDYEDQLFCCKTTSKT